MRLTSLPALGVLGGLLTAAPLFAAEAASPPPEEAPTVRVIEPRRALAPEHRSSEPKSTAPEATAPEATAPEPAEPKSAEPSSAAPEPPVAFEPRPNAAVDEPTVDEPAAEKSSRKPAEETSPPENDFRETAAPRDATAASPPFFRFGVAGVAGTSTFDQGAVRFGLDAHFGAQLTPTFALFGGFLVGLTVEPRTPRTQQIFYGQFEGDYDDFFYASAGPAGGIVPRSSTNLEDFSFAAGFLARAGVLVGRRNEGGRKNAFLVGLAFVGLVGDEFYSFPMVTLGYERF